MMLIYAVFSNLWSIAAIFYLNGGVVEAARGGRGRRRAEMRSPRRQSSVGMREGLPTYLGSVPRR